MQIDKRLSIIFLDGPYYQYAITCHPELVSGSQKGLRTFF